MDDCSAMMAMRLGHMFNFTSYVANATRQISHQEINPAAKQLCQIYPKTHSSRKRKH
jgi:hypothetical protein